MKRFLWRSTRTLARVLALASIALAGLLGAPAPAAQCQNARFVPFDGALSDDFGGNVAVCGDWAAIGARHAYFSSPPGAVYLYRRFGLNWFFHSKLTPPDVILDDNYASSLALSGGVLVVGAFQADPGGVAYVFELVGSAWTQTARLASPLSSVGDDFGLGLATDGRTIFVGAHREQSPVSCGGAVHAFRKDSGAWAEVQRLEISGAAFLHEFGVSLSIDGSVLVVGAPGDDQAAPDAGALYVFEEIGTMWVQTAKVVTNTAEALGWAVAVSGETILAGDAYEDEPFITSGSAYVFERQNGAWIQTARLLPSEPEVNLQYGFSVSLDGGTGVIGAWNPGGFGAAYVVERQGSDWVETERLTPRVENLFDYFGSSVSLEGDTLLVGARGNDLIAQNAGAAYGFSVSDIDCLTLEAEPGELSLSAGGTQTMTLRAGSGVGGATYWVVGSISGTDPGFPLGTTQVPINPDSYFALTLVPGASPLEDSMGVLTASGKAKIRLVLPPLSDPSLAGLTVSHAAVAFTLAPFQVLHVSNPVTLGLID